MESKSISLLSGADQWLDRAASARSSEATRPRRRRECAHRLEKPAGCTRLGKRLRRSCHRVGLGSTNPLVTVRQIEDTSLRRGRSPEPCSLRKISPSARGAARADGSTAITAAHGVVPCLREARPNQTGQSPDRGLCEAEPSNSEAFRLSNIEIVPKLDPGKLATSP